MNADTEALNPGSEARQCRHVTHCRVWLYAFGAIYLSWSFLLKTFAPELWDSVGERLLLSLACAGIATASFFSDYLRRNIERIATVCAVVSIIHFATMMYRAGFGYIYGIGGSIIAAAVMTVGAISIYDNLAFAIACTIAVSVAATLAPTTLAIKVFAVIASTMVLVVFHLMLRQRVAAEDQYVAQREDLIKLQKNAMQKELDDSRLLLETFRDIECIVDEISIRKLYRPSFYVSGDWVYHFVNRERGCVYAWISDVTGHGAASALITALMHGALKTAFTTPHSGITNAELLLSIADTGNQLLLDTRCGRWMTAVLIALDLKTGNLDVLNCGHPFPFVKQATGLTTLTEAVGDPLGMKGTRPIIKSLTLSPGDELFCYTDGLVENGCPKTAISKRKVRSLLQKSANQDEMLSSLALHCDKLEQLGMNDDDVTVLSMKYLMTA